MLTLQCERDSIFLHFVASKECRMTRAARRKRELKEFAVVAVLVLMIGLAGGAFFLWSIRDLQ